MSWDWITPAVVVAAFGWLKFDIHQLGKRVDQLSKRVDGVTERLARLEGFMEGIQATLTHRMSD